MYDEACMCTYVPIYIHTFTCRCTCVHMYIRTWSPLMCTWNCLLKCDAGYNECRHMHVCTYICVYVYVHYSLHPHFSRQFQAHIKGDHGDAENCYVPCRYQFSCVARIVRHLGWNEYTLTDKREHRLWKQYYTGCLERWKGTNELCIYWMWCSDLLGAEMAVPF